MGTAKTLVEIRSLARGHTRAAVRVLVIMRSNDATPAARVSAANAILDWGWGKATQPLENSGEDALEPIHRIERVIGAGDDVADSLAELHQLTFLDTTPVPKFDGGTVGLPLAEPTRWPLLASLPPPMFSMRTIFAASAYWHFGHRLQLRLMRDMEARARLNGWCSIISDTTDNMHAANNFIRAGYRLFIPTNPWGWPHTLYWRKDMK